MNFLSFNYNKAVNQANRIESIADDMLSIANNQLRQTIESIGVSWQGEASDHFLQNCDAALADIRAQANRLRELARRINEAAKSIRDAEVKTAAVKNIRA